MAARARSSVHFEFFALLFDDWPCFPLDPSARSLNACVGSLLGGFFTFDFAPYVISFFPGPGCQTKGKPLLNHHYTKQFCQLHTLGWWIRGANSRGMWTGRSSGNGWRKLSNPEVEEHVDPPTLEQGTGRVDTLGRLRGDKTTNQNLGLS